MDAGETIGAAEFKAHCLEILDRLSAREVSRVTITKRGRPVAVLVPPDDARDAVRRIHGFLRGSVVIPPGTDLTAPDSRSAIRCGGRTIAPMTATPGAVLLDTCAVIWLANGDRLRQQAADAIVAAGLSGGILVSPVSAWEVGLLARPRGRNHAAAPIPPGPEGLVRARDGRTWHPARTIHTRYSHRRLAPARRRAWRSSRSDDRRNRSPTRHSGGHARRADIGLCAPRPRRRDPLLMPTLRATGSRCRSNTGDRA